MKSDWPLLIEVLRGERSLSHLVLSEWDLLIRQARRAQLLGKLYYLAEAQQVLETLPVAVFRHLKSAQVHADKQYRDFLWEVGKLKQAFAGSHCPLIFLKGGGYAIAQLQSYKGRLFSDIDLLVPFESIADMEKRLMIHGWIGEKQDAYDQQYYRRWMHEIPPLRHVRRGSVIDLHHNILPRTASACPDVKLLLHAAISLEADNQIKVLSPLDRIIHSATHLFYEGELEHGLRDLVDLKDLIGELNAEDKLALVDRARQLGLLTPVYYALRYLSLILNMTGLEATMQKMRDEGFRLPYIRLMDALFLRALQPDHASCGDIWTPLARWLLYMRAHGLRMPWYLLISHLSRKAWIRLSGSRQP